MKNRILVAALLLVTSVTAVFGQSKPASIKLMIDGTFLVKENGEQVMVDEFKKLSGIDLVLNHPIHNEYYTKVDLAFATGAVPEVLLLGANPYVKYAVAGMLVDMTSMVNSSNIKKNLLNPAMFESLKIDGKLYGIPFERGNGTITYVRGDWLEKLNMKAPTNYDEFIAMLRAFKNNNPDGLSPEQVIPLTSAGLVNSEYPLDIYLREFYQDGTPDFVMSNGKWADGMVLPSMEKALERMRSAYAEGLIDTEIVTNKTSTAREKLATGKVGVFNYWAGAWNVNLQKLITPNVPQSKITPIAAIKETKYIERPGTMFSIVKSAKNPKGIFKYFHEFVLDGGKGQTWATFGSLGKTYEIKDGKIVWLPSIQDPKKPFAKAMISAEIPVNKWTSNYVVDPVAAKSLEMFQKDCVQYPFIPYSEEANELVADLNMIRTKYVTEIVFGKLTVKDGLAAYSKEAGKYTKIILKELNATITTKK